MERWVDIRSRALLILCRLRTDLHGNSSFVAAKATASSPNKRLRLEEKHGRVRGRADAL